MKATIFLFSIIVLIGLGIYMFTNKDNPDAIINLTQNETIEVLEKEKEKEEEKFLSPEEWKDALVGTWEFSANRVSTKELHYFNGEVEYLADGTFIRYVTHKYYIPYSNDRLIGYEKGYDNKLAIVAGGSVKGTWTVLPEKGIWKEVVTSCTIKPSFTLDSRREHKGYDTCKRDFKGTLYYGTFSTDDTKVTLKKFTRESIDISGNNFKEDATIAQGFTKQF